MDLVVVINLERRPDRLSKFRIQFPGLEFERFRAIDAQDVEVPDYWLSRPGNYACNQSHIGVLKQALARGIERLAVFEDDARPVVRDGVGFEPRLQRLMASVPEAWDGLWLGGRKMMKGKWTTRGVYRAKFMLSRVAYCLRPKGMRVALSHWERTPSSGDWCNLQIMQWARIYRPNPLIVYHPSNFSDTKNKSIRGFR